MNVDIHSLRREFEKYGAVLSCKIQSHGFNGYVNMLSLDGAKKAAIGLDGKYLGEYGCAMQLRQAGPPPTRGPYNSEQVGGYDYSRWRNRSSSHDKRIRKWQTMRQPYRYSYRHTKSGPRLGRISNQGRWSSS